ncbi:DUF1554 domain-containing protein, partial [Pseudoalteromonas luteoviolacea]
AMDTALAAKADTATVITQLSAKADKTAMDTALSAKADTATVNTQLSAKADQAAVNTALAAKADTTSVNTQLAAKADQTSVNTALESTLKFNANKLVWAANQAYEIGQVVRFDLSGDLFVAIKAVDDTSTKAPFMDAEHWTLLMSGIPSVSTNKKVIFTTTSQHNGALGGIAGANAICQSEADSSESAPKGTYKALLSGYNSHAKNVVSNVNSYHKVDGTLVAQSGVVDFFKKPLLSPLNMNANGEIVGGYVWTNTSFSGFANDFNACSGFTRPFGEAWYVETRSSVSHAGFTDGWINTGTIACTQNARLYCVQQ